jgi:hypothetical protein
MRRADCAWALTIAARRSGAASVLSRVSLRAGARAGSNPDLWLNVARSGGWPTIMCSLFRDIYREGNTLSWARSLIRRHAAATASAPLRPQPRPIEGCPHRGIYPARKNNGKDPCTPGCMDPSHCPDLWLELWLLSERRLFGASWLPRTPPAAEGSRQIVMISPYIRINRPEGRWGGGRPREG